MRSQEDWVVQDVVEECNKLDGVKKIGKETVRKTLRRKLRLKYRKTRKIRNPKFFETRTVLITIVFVIIVCNLIRKGKKFLFLDESSFQNMNNVGGVWTSGQGEEIVPGANRMKKLGLLMGMSREKVEHWEVSEETVNSSDMVCYFQKLRETLPKEENPDLWLIMDNERYHKSEKTVECLQQLEFNVLYTPPYTPQSNAAEYIFSILKRKIRRKMPETR